jgi:hypothetical protein
MVLIIAMDILGGELAMWVCIFPCTHHSKAGWKDQESTPTINESHWFQNK